LSCFSEGVLRRVWKKKGGIYRDGSCLG